METTTTNTNSASNTNPEKKKTLKLNPNPKKFLTIGEVSQIKTSDLAKIINDIFGRVFSDWHGSVIEIRYDSIHRSYYLNPILQFRVLDKSEYDFSKVDGHPRHFYGFNRMDVHNGNTNLLGRIQRFASSSAHNGPKVEMTEDFKEIMKDYVITNPNNNSKFDWDTCFSTVVIGGNTYIRMAKIDIVKLLKAVYGAKDPVTGSDYYYQPMLNKPVNIGSQYQQIPFGGYDDWWITIQRLNEKNELFIAEQQGFVMQSGSIPGNVITERYVGD